MRPPYTHSLCWSPGDEFMNSIEAVYTYEGTDSIQSLIVGRAITGISAVV
jgi:hypothetical protein